MVWKMSRSAFKGVAFLGGKNNSARNERPHVFQIQSQLVVVGHDKSFFDEEIFGRLPIVTSFVDWQAWREGVVLKGPYYVFHHFPDLQLLPTIDIVKQFEIDKPKLLSSISQVGNWPGIRQGLKEHQYGQIVNMTLVPTKRFPDPFHLQTSDAQLFNLENAVPSEMFPEEDIIVPPHIVSISSSRLKKRTMTQVFQVLLSDGTSQSAQADQVSDDMIREFNQARREQRTLRTELEPMVPVRAPVPAPIPMAVVVPPVECVYCNKMLKNNRGLQSHIRQSADCKLAQEEEAINNI